MIYNVLELIYLNPSQMYIINAKINVKQNLNKSDNKIKYLLQVT